MTEDDEDRTVLLGNGELNSDKARLICTNAPTNAGIEIGFVLELPTSGEFSIGRGNENTLSVQSEELSRNHLKITFSNGHWSVEDVGSTNGTYVNGDKIQSWTFKPGDSLNFGGLGFDFSMDTPTSDNGEPKAESDFRAKGYSLTRPKKTGLIIAGLALVSVSVIAVGIILTRDTSPDITTETPLPNAVREDARPATPKPLQTDNENLHLKAEEQARLKADVEQARLKGEEDARLKAEVEQARLKGEEDARLKAEVEQARLKAVEEQARLKAEDDARLRAEEQARIKAEENARVEAAEQSRFKAEEQTRLRAEKEARIKAAVQKQRLGAIDESMWLDGTLTIQDKKLIQTGLKKSGFLSDGVDGVFGPSTRKAIRAYQLSLKQETTGFLDANQLASLRAIGRSVEETAQLEAEEQARIKAEETARLEAEEQARIKAEEDARLETEEQARIKAEEEARLEAEEQARIKAEETARLEAEEQARIKAEEDARIEAAEQAQVKAEEEARIEAAEQARIKAGEDARLRAEEQARIKAEEDARLEAEEQARIKAEEEARLEAEEQARIKAEEDARIEAEEQARLKAEEDARLEAEEQARIKAEEDARIEAEEQARIKAGETARLEAEEQARIKAEEDARLEAEEQARIKAEEDARLEAAEQAQVKAEEDARLEAAEQARIKASVAAKSHKAVGNVAKAPEMHLDPAMVVGPDACGECHKSSVAIWKKTKHASTFKKLPRKKEAKAIAKKLGIRRMKTASACLSCHFTSAEVKGRVKPIAGITCESCHGAGKNWIKEHSDYGGKGITRESETPDHKKARFTKSEAAGMIRPLNLYKIAANCYSCHTVPNEKLVNEGGHAAGSKFDLVAWSQGEVRHNVWYSKSNDEASAARKRMMYIVGKALDLEFALRGIAKATKKATYAVSMAKRANSARTSMKKIATIAGTSEIKAIVAASDVKLKLNNSAKLTAAADKIAAAADKFVAAHDGSKFAGIDAMIPGAGKYKGKIAP